MDFITKEFGLRRSSERRRDAAHQKWALVHYLSSLDEHQAEAWRGSSFCEAL